MHGFLIICSNDLGYQKHIESLFSLKIKRHYCPCVFRKISHFLKQRNDSLILLNQLRKKTLTSPTIKNKYLRFRDIVNKYIFITFFWDTLTIKAAKRIALIQKLKIFFFIKISHFLRIRNAQQKNKKITLLEKVFTSIPSLQGRYNIFSSVKFFFFRGTRIGERLLNIIGDFRKVTR